VATTNERILFAHRSTLVEASPLISFLKVRRFGLVESVFPSLVVTAQVVAEVLLFPQRELLAELVNAGRVNVVELENPVELAAFADLVDRSPLGWGEASSIAVAAFRRWPLLITDRKGIREARRRGVECATTEDVLVELVQRGILDSDAVDALVEEWALVDEYPVVASALRERLAKLNIAT
jgi:predicted nucleic acid-binding protein